MTTAGTLPNELDQKLLRVHAFLLQMITRFLPTRFACFSNRNMR